MLRICSAAKARVRLTAISAVILVWFGQNCYLSYDGHEEEQYDYPPSTLTVQPIAAAYGNGYFAVVGDAYCFVAPPDAETVFGGACSNWGQTRPQGSFYSGFFCVCDRALQEAHFGYPTAWAAIPPLSSDSYFKFRMAPRVQDVCYGDGKFVAVSYGLFGGPPYDTGVWVSSLYVFDTNNPGWSAATLDGGWEASVWDVWYGREVSSLAYGGGVFVAVFFAEDGPLLLTSPDASPSSWSVRSPGVSVNYSDFTRGTDLVYGSDRFVLLVGDYVLWAQDATAWWTKYRKPDGMQGRLTYMNGLFYVVNATTVWRSPDGTEGSWEAVSMGQLGDFVPSHLCPGDGAILLGMPVLNADYTYDEPAYESTQWRYTDTALANVAEIRPFGDDRYVTVTPWMEYEVYNKAIAWGGNMFLAFNSVEFDLTSTDHFTADGLIRRSADGSPGSWDLVDASPALIIPRWR